MNLNFLQKPINQIFKSIKLNLMCLPIGLLKTILAISCLITMALGVIAIVCGATLGEGDEQAFVDDVKQSRKIIMGVTIAFGVFLIILSIFGMIGAFKKSSLCLTIYNIGIMIFFIIFLAIAIACFVVFKKYSGSGVQGVNLCNDQTWLKNLDTDAAEANQLLCSLACPCAANSTSNWIPGNLAFNVNGSINVQGCPNYNNSGGDNVGVMQYLEETFNCEGVCTQSQYYTFSNINRGQPTDDCAQKLMDVLLKYSKEIGAVTITIAVVLFLIMVLSCCLCCHPKKKEEFDNAKGIFCFFISHFHLFC